MNTRLFAEDTIADPFPLLNRLREEDPVHWDAELCTWLITRHEDVSYLLRHAKLFSSEIYVRSDGLDLPLDADDRPLVNWCTSFRRHEVIQNDPPHHERMRAELRDRFSPRYLETHWRDRIRATVARLLTGVESAGRMDIMHDLAVRLPFLVIMEMLGIPSEDRPSLWEQANNRLASLMSLKGDRIRRSAEGIRVTSDYLEHQIDARMRCPASDLLGVLTEAERAGHYSRAEVQANAQLLIDAGFVTTIDLICNGTLALLRHGDQWELLTADPSNLAASTTEECLRFDPPVPLSYRIATEDIELRGKRIAGGQRVAWAIAAANRDPRVFRMPDKFDIRRSPNRHLSLGGGIHFCLGQYLARIEGQEVVMALASRFPTLRLAVDFVEYEPVRGVHHLKSLPVAWN